jgi:predicted deacylase
LRGLIRSRPASPRVEKPVAVIRGPKPGPTLALVAGAHGTEYASIIALEKLIQELNPADISGTVIIVPLVNIASFEQKVPQECAGYDVGASNPTRILLLTVPE